MADPVISPAYKQIVDWYQHWQTMEMAKPITLLGAGSEPVQGGLETTTDPTTQLDIYV
jgi:hypothetical protein